MMMMIDAKTSKYVMCRWNHDVRPTVNDSAPIEAVSGHGLISTKWNGCRTIILFIYKLFTWKVTVLFILKVCRGERIPWVNLQFIALKSATLQSIIFMFSYLVGFRGKR